MQRDDGAVEQLDFLFPYIEMDRNFTGDEIQLNSKIFRNVWQYFSRTALMD